MNLERVGWLEVVFVAGFAAIAVNDAGFVVGVAVTTLVVFWLVFLRKVIFG